MPEKLDATDETDAPRPRRRFRRWVVRPAVWAFVLLLLLIALIPWMMRLSWAQERGRAFVIARLSAALDSEVDIQGLEVTPWPLSAEVRGLRIQGVGESERPLAEVERVRIQASLEGLRRPVIHLDQVEIEKPRVFIDLRADGTSNLPRPQGGGGGRGLEWEIGDLSVDDGWVFLGERRMPLDVEAAEVWALLEGAGRGLDLLGRVAAQQVEVTLPGGQPYAVATTARLRLREEGLELEKARLFSPEIEATLGGDYRFGEGGELALDFEARGRAELVPRMGLTNTALAGDFQAAGRIEAQGSAWTLTGQATAPDLRADGRRVRAIEARFTGSPERLQVDLDRALFAAGTAQGAILVPLGESAGRVDLDLQVSGLDLELLVLESVEPADREALRPVARRLAGRLSGPIRYGLSLSDPLSGDGSARLALAPPESPSDRLVLTGELAAQVSAGVLTLAQTELRNPQQSLRIEDFELDLESARGEFLYALDSSDLRPWLSFVPPETRQELQDYLPTTGSGQVEGAVVLGEAIAVDARLALAGLQAPLWRSDRLNGAVRLAEEAVFLEAVEVERSGGTVVASGRIGLAELTPGSLEPRLALDLRAAGWPVAELQPFFGPASGGAPTLEGRLSGDFALRDVGDGLQGLGSVSVAEAVVVGHELGEVSARVELGPQVVQASSLRIDSSAGPLTGEARFDLDGSGSLALELEGEALDLSAAPLAAYAEPVGLTGRLGLSASAAGSLEVPALDLSLALEDGRLDGRPVAPSRLEAQWDGQELATTGSLLGIVEISGGGRLTPEEADLTLALACSDLTAARQVLAPLDGPFPGGELGGSLQGDLRIAGPWSEPTVELTLPQVTLLYGDRQLRSLEPVEAHLEGQSLILDTLYLAESGTENYVFARGSVALSDEGALDLQLESSLDASWLNPFTLGARLRQGRLNALMEVEGTARRPRLNGLVGLENGAVLLDGFPHEVRQVEAVALAYPERWVLDKMEGRVGGGRVTVAGEIDLRDGCCSRYRFQGNATDVRLRYPEDWRVRADANVVLMPAADGVLLRGFVDLREATYSRDLEVSPAQLLTAFLRKQRLEANLADEALSAVELNIAVRGDEALRIRNNLADLRGDADLRVSGTLARPVILGEVELQEEGTLEFGGNEYEVERGRVTFARIDRIDPVIDLVASTQVSEYDVTLNLSGNLERMNTEFTSDPPLPFLGVLELLATGESTGSFGTFSPTRRGGGNATETATNFLYGQAASVVTDRVKTLFRFDKLRIDPTGSAGAGVNSARITLGKQISRDLYVTYTGEPASNQQEVVQAEWRVRPGLTLIFTVTDGDAYAMDLRWDTRF